MKGKDIVVNYAKDVVGGKITAGRLIQLTCKRFLDDLDNPDLEFRDYHIDRFIRLCSALHHYQGEFNGVKIELQPWQLFCFANIFCWYRTNGSRRFKTSYIEMAKKQGKALSLDTPIPTPTGWTTMGALREGDYILGADGKPTMVTFKTPVQYNRKCYQITLSDGEIITADAEHLWHVRTNSKNGKYEYEDLTTEQLIGKKNYRIPMNEALEFQNKELVIDPYVLGVWLGDGHSSTATFSSSTDDIEIYDYISTIYGEYKLHRDKRCKKGIRICFSDNGERRISTLTQQLKEIGALNNKHIPIDYLRASKEQRLALLQGIMDTDGYVSVNGQCEFSQKSEKLTNQFCELLSSLGIKYHLTDRYTNANDKSFKSFRVQFYCDKQMPCFRLKRKYDRLKDKLSFRMKFKSIRSITPTESVPVACISVDNKDSLYLCGRKMTVTHNTMQSVLFLLYANLSDGGSPETYLAANSREQAKIAFEMLKQLSGQLDPKAKDIRVLRNEVRIKANNGLIKVLSSDSSKADGLNVSYAIIDEYHESRTNAMYENLLSATAAKKNSHICIITTAGFDLTYPCYEQRNYCIQCLNKEIEDDTIFSAIYEMDEDDDIEDKSNWIKCNPNMDVTVSLDFLEKRFQTAKQSPSQEVAILTKNFNKWMQSKETWIQDNYIVRAMSKQFDFDDIIKSHPNDDWWFFQGCDLGATSDLTAVTTLLTNHNQFYFRTDVYLPEDTMKTNVNREAYKVWNRGGYLKLTNGNVTDYNVLANDVVQFGENHDVVEFGYDKYNATSIVIDMVNKGVNCVEYGQNMLNFNAPTKMLEKLILEGNAYIEKSPLVRWCFNNVELRQDLNGNVKPDKSNREKKIDPIISMITALGVYLRFFNN